MSTVRELTGQVHSSLEKGELAVETARTGKIKEYVLELFTS